MPMMELMSTVMTSPPAQLAGGSHHGVAWPANTGMSLMSSQACYN